ncbi:hypothetical protein BKA70DRAFT_1220261 [Coprinopsis sp. MPI-PUGE-AT-0042]|nr:hypothetical protein BKA70DRAFT_1220261 [Coprinopsis sp. MPI-PUGE-AT-0042]
MASPASFGFLDPRDALQAVQIIPHFALGKLRESSIAISALANDSDPYKAYYVNRGRNPPGSNDIVINSSNPPAGTVAPNWNTTSDREYALVDSDDDSSSESESEGGE